MLSSASSASSESADSWQAELGGNRPRRGWSWHWCFVFGLVAAALLLAILWLSFDWLVIYLCNRWKW